MTCEVCRKIESLYDDDNDDEAEKRSEVDLGNLKHVIASKCEFHLKLMGLDTEQQNELGNATPASHENLSNVVAQRYKDRLTITHWYEHEVHGGKRGYSLATDLVLYRVADQKGMAPPLDDSWVDAELLGKWIRSCDSHHQASCRDRWLRSESAGVRPRLLVDTGQKCLVESTGQEYYALSYVWGKALSFSTTTSNLNRLKLPKALAAKEAWSALTETIRNAIELVEKLGPPFLWVDALCVIQDDDAMRHSEIEKMCSIFANASATIIAGSGSDANHGLRGLRDIGRPRVLRDRPIYSMPGGHNFVAPLFHWYGHMSSVGNRYGKRAWTFQEHLLSRRRIIFEDQSVRWECEGADWTEDVDHEMELGQEPSSAKEIRIFRAVLRGENTEQGSRIAEFVSEFNRRELSYPQDALFACAGILSMLVQHGRGYISGMPALDFDVAMLWQPRGCIDRRIAKYRDPHNDDLLADCAPSWSWAGWQCALDPFCWDISSKETTNRNFGYGFNGSYVMQLVPTVTWQYSNSLDGEALRLDELGAVHQRIRYVFCKTRRSVGALKIGTRMRNVVDGPGSYRRHPFHYEILDPSQQRIGLIEVSPPAEPAMYQDYLANDIEFKPLLHGTALDLVEISATDVQVKEQLEDNDDISTPAEWMLMLNDIGCARGSQKIYNVLWIIWKNGFAERRALGWVDARAWDKIDLVKIDLALG